VYENMPQFGLAMAGEHLPVGRKGESLADRMRAGATPPGGPVDTH
jgi:hypothetical protein